MNHSITPQNQTKPNSINVFTDASTHRRVYSVFTLVCFLAFFLVIVIFSLTEIEWCDLSTKLIKSCHFGVCARVRAPVYTIRFFPSHFDEIFSSRGYTIRLKWKTIDWKMTFNISYRETSVRPFSTPQKNISVHSVWHFIFFFLQ